MSAGLQSLQRLSERVLPCLFQVLVAPVVPWLWLHNSSLCFCLHVAFSSSLCVSLLCVTLVMGFRTHPDYPGGSHLEILNSVTSFPNQPTFTGSGCIDTLGEALFNTLQSLFAEAISPTLLYLEKSFKSPLQYHFRTPHRYETLPELHYQTHSQPSWVYSSLFTCVAFITSIVWSIRP